MAGYAGRSTQVQLGDMTAGSPINIVDVTVTSGVADIEATAHGLANNDIVEIAAVGGILNINDYHLVRVTDANNFTLNGSPNLSGTYTSGGTVTKQNGAYTNIPAILSIEDGEEDDEIDVSAMDTPQGFREFVAGMIGADFTLQYNWLPNSVGQGMVAGLYNVKRSTTPVWWRLLFPQVSTTHVPAKAFLGVLLSLRETASTEGKLEGNGRGRITRARIMTPGT
jgi:hypothetical protein